MCAAYRTPRWSSPVAQYLAAAGVGHLGLLDGDNVSLHNLQRQVIHNTSDVGTQKVRSAAQKILALNPDVQTTEIPLFLSEDNALDIIRDYDFVIDVGHRCEVIFFDLGEICNGFFKKFFSHIKPLSFLRVKGVQKQLYKTIFCKI